MNVYWDSSALVAATIDGSVRRRLKQPGQWTRSHTFAEVFSTLTGNRLGFRVDATEAADIVGDLKGNVSIVDLTTDELLGALYDTRALGVRGGRVHDFLHGVAARKAGCQAIRTLNTADFDGLFPAIRLLLP